LYFSATISVKEDVMGRHVARVGWKGMLIVLWWENQKEWDH
jgi:hypothetical protein